MHGSFYGWYLKCQSDTQTLAVIPAVHQTGRKRTCSIQIITNNGVWTIPFPVDEFRKTKKHIYIGENRLGRKGIRLSIETPELTVKGKLQFGPLLSLKYDIMGPFALVPFLECLWFSNVVCCRYSHGRYSLYRHYRHCVMERKRIK